MQIIPVSPEHIPAIQKIYAWHVVNGIATFETVPPTTEEMEERIVKVQAAGTPWLVAIVNGVVAGYCYLAPYRPRLAYRFTLEDSIYIDPQQQGKGIGKALLTEAINQVELAGFHQLVTVVGNSENCGSISLHRSLGFELTGTLKSVGFKHGRWVDTVIMQKTLGSGDTNFPE
ncbi:GNAT family N-acetyltransferase [Pectobacterium wasabiae]|uniref:Phosphinothricin acetyltransferase n=1 Tax=Pectobacterium wasabiae TaxID=55208 RepID=A0AAW3EFX2_9GAMM|nr:GNAT family N-acetyltransferase [Pectobacterium wasabiae]AOR66054.1 phosphinothricin acetyltransferase [Pectobacterium wasabiae CFBP 3304]EJS96090.1 Putative phosphinothricin N-acetyltransferase [Pectobacterium wasabiae CFBP 3304]KFW97983.1 phosphinothricin acetyltransferase [Pectobacterium wasabiae]KGA25187.1 phosphinothricin acetyltransferase [Pectobacterium wasabiae]